jgi:hypothetical protein
LLFSSLVLTIIHAGACGVHVFAFSSLVLTATPRCLKVPGLFDYMAFVYYFPAFLAGPSHQVSGLGCMSVRLCVCVCVCGPSLAQDNHHIATPSSTNLVRSVLRALVCGGCVLVRTLVLCSVHYVAQVFVSLFFAVFIPASLTPTQHPRTVS